jgi:hypothetical protein
MRGHLDQFRLGGFQLLRTRSCGSINIFPIEKIHRRRVIIFLDGDVTLFAL